MKALRVVFRLGLLIGLGIEIPGLPATAQTTSPKEAQPPAPGLRKLTGDDAKRAEELDKAIEAALEGRSLGRGDCEGRGTARLADAGPGAEALRDGERGVASQDVAPGGPDAEGGSSRLPIGRDHE